MAEALKENRSLTTLDLRCEHGGMRAGTGEGGGSGVGVGGREVSIRVEAYRSMPLGVWKNYHERSIPTRP